MSFREQLDLVETQTQRLVARCAAYRRRNLFIMDDDSIALVTNNRTVVTTPTLLKATQLVDSKPEAFPYV